MEKRCEECKILFAIENKKLKRFCSERCRKRKENKRRYERSESLRKRKKITSKNWHQNNKKRQNKNVLNDYYRNKSHWRERKYTYVHREKILKILPKNCFLCNKIGINEIHHTRYEDLSKGNLINYSKTLMGFCSRECHRKYERINSL